MAFRSHLRHALLTAGILLVVGACVDTPAGSAPDVRMPSGPALGRATTSGDQTLLQPANFDPIARYVQRPHATTYWIKQWVGPEGGTVDFLGFKIIVPPGAVDRVTMFQIKIPGENDPDHQEHVYAEFGPHNVLFKVPVRLEMPYANTNAYGYAAGGYWYNEHDRTWEWMGGGITADGQRVWFDMPHFSTGGAGFAPSGGTSTGAGG
jgi:hypothetical protein